MNIQEWLEILRKERELLIEKTRWGTYASVVILGVAFIQIYTVLSDRDEFVFQSVGPIVQKIIILALLTIILIGILFLLIFLMRNYWRYQKIEETIDRWMDDEKTKHFPK